MFILKENRFINRKFVVIFTQVLSDWLQALIEMFLSDLSILQVVINHPNWGQFIIW